MPGALGLGCAVWACQDWVGDLYPAGSRSRDFLALYARRFTAVEVNATFYAAPDPTTLAKWVAQTPAGFAFCPKLPRTLTHGGGLAPAIEATQAFLQRMAPLHDRLGAYFAQLPPTYSPQVWDDLQAFVRAWPQGVPLALEVRHRDWFAPPHAERLNHLLTACGIGRVCLDTRPIYASPDPAIQRLCRKPNVPVDPVATAAIAIVRFVSHPDPARNAPWMAAWTATIAPWLAAGRQAFVFIHCPIEARSPHNARAFHRTLVEAGIALPPLPWEGRDCGSVQLGLFG